MRCVKSVQGVLIRKDEGVVRPEHGMRFFVYLSAGAKQGETIIGKHRNPERRVGTVADRRNDVELQAETRLFGEEIVAWNPDRCFPKIRTNSPGLPGIPSRCHFGRNAIVAEYMTIDLYTYLRRQVEQSAR